MSSRGKVSVSSIELPPSDMPVYKYQSVEMEERSPIIVLATEDGNKPHDDGDQAQATVVASLQLMDACKQDSSLVVVDVGALLGNPLIVT